MVTDASAAGQNGECPACHTPFIVPIPAVETGKPAETASEAARAVEMIPSAEVEKIESCFMAVMGPIGPKIVRKVIGAGTTRAALRAELLEAIPVEEDRVNFLRCCGRLLAASPTAEGVTLLDSAGIAELKTILATFLGPLARVLVDRALPTAASVDDLIHHLAGELDTPEERERFERAATEGLRKHFRLK
jgi:hypothetical protein